MPFEGFNVDTFNYVSDHTGDIVIHKEATASSLTHDFKPSEFSVNLAPYQTVLQSAGTIVYTEPQDLQSAGSQPVYVSANTLDINALSKPQTAAADNATVPTFIQLHEQTSETGTNSQTDLRQSIIAFTMDHLTLVIPAALLTFVFLTLLIVWLRRIIKRHLHRRRYQRLRNARLQKNDKIN